MNKFKIGDEVRVKRQVDALSGEFGVISAFRNDGIIVVIHGIEYWYEEIELTSGHQRTLLGLETELHSILLQVNKLQEEIDKLKALEE